MRILPDSRGKHIVAYCKICKTENIVDIEMGQCSRSQSQ
jgi:hypothetical protein